MADDNMQAVIDAARAGIVPVKLETVGTTAHYFASGIGLKTIDLEAGMDTPARKRGSVKVFDADSFNKILAENDDAGNTTVYVDRDAINPAIVAVLNGHGSGVSKAGWGDFRVNMAFRKTPQWVKWSGIDGKFLSQQDFANFIEDNLLDIRDPAPADMLEISQFMEVTRTTNFKSVTRPKSGVVQFKNEQSDAVSESIKVPDTIKLFIAPLFGLPPMEILTRFRYRLDGGALKLGVKMQRVEEIMAMILQEIVSEIALPAGGVMVEGVAPTA